MSWFSPYRWLLLGGLIIALILGYHAWKDHQQDIGYERARSEYTAAALIEQTKNAKITAAWQKQKDEALHDANERAIQSKADAERLRTTNGGLRNELARARGQLSGASCDSVRRHATALNTVFEQCTREVEDLAGAASGIAVETLMLQQAWPK